MHKSSKRIESCGSIALEENQRASRTSREQLYCLLRERKEEEEQRPPPFDVAVIKKEDAARKNQELQFFIEALEGWNTSFGRPEVKFDRARYEALKFIYFHLKNISLQNELIRNENIHRLYIWYQHYNNNFTPPLALRIRGSQFRQVKEDQEEVRKTFISSLPQKIDSFERKIFLPHCSKRMRVKPPQPSATEQLTQRRYTNEQKLMRQQVEKEELQRTITQFKSRKARFQQTRTGLTDHSMNLSRQVRRMPRDNSFRKVLTHMLTARIHDKENMDSSRSRFPERLCSEGPTTVADIDGLTLLHNPLESTRRH